jgi:hypothetical protein
MQRENRRAALLESDSTARSPVGLTISIEKNQRNKCHNGGFLTPRLVSSLGTLNKTIHGIVRSGSDTTVVARRGSSC